MRTLKIDSLVLTGVVTNVCVESTARDAFMMDYNVTVIEDGCAGTNPAWHKASLDHMPFGFAQVLTALEVIEYWRRSERIIKN